MSNGLLGVIKPPGMTSFDVIRLLRRISGIRRMGHTGTVDRLGSGVLVIAVGRATRLVEYLMGEKEYFVEVRLGRETDTGDLEGQTLHEAEVPPLDREKVLHVLHEFVGEILQEPPAVSAKKVHGRRASDLYRRGVQVQLKPQRVRIRELELVRMLEEPPALQLRVRCSAGTYMRSLARDIGRRLGVGGHVSFLVRLYSHPFHISECVPVNTLLEVGDLGPYLRPPDRGLEQLPMARLSLAESRKFVRGARVRAPGIRQGHLVRVYDSTGLFLGLARRQGHFLQPTCVLAEG